MGAKQSFLEHLAGLRGVAIILVVLFHMNAAQWSQGYLGVDVFLVITGYLIVRGRMARQGMESWRDALGYLGKRVQRIVPPMLVVILGSLVAGMVFLWWQDELFLSKLGFAACLGRANIMLAREFADYFASDSAFIPLLHLWYLSVVLQVYGLYAVGNQLLQRLPKGVCISLLWLVGVASLIYCYSGPLAEWLGLSCQGVSYYQTLPRLWEVLAGGLVCLLPGVQKRLWCSVLAGVGMGLVLLPALSGTLPCLSGIAQLPCALLVVVGTVLVLRYTQDSCLRVVLSNKVIVWLGKVSFSIYLVHMPIIVMMRMWALGQPSVAGYAGMLLVSVAVGGVFWYAVEKRRFSWWLVVLLWVAALLLCRHGRKTSGFRRYLPASQWVMPTYEQWQLCTEESVKKGFEADQFSLFEGVFRWMNQRERIPARVSVPLLVMGVPSAAPTCLLMGDSHAAHSFAGLDVVLKQEGIAGLYLSSFIYPLHGWQEDCQPRYGTYAPREQALLRWLQVHPEITHIIIGQRWWSRFADHADENIEALRFFLQSLHDLGKVVVIIAPTPEFSGQGAQLHYDKIFTLQGKSGAEAEAAAAVCTREQYRQLNEHVLGILHSMQEQGLCEHIIYPLQALGEGEVFHSMREGKMLINDLNHLNPGLSIWLMERLRGQIRAALQPAAPASADPSGLPPTP